MLRWQARKVSCGSDGDNTLVKCSSGRRIMVRKIIASPNADASGEFTVKFKDKIYDISGILNAKSGSQYLMLNVGDKDAQVGDSGEDLVFNIYTGYGDSVTVNIEYIEATAEELAQIGVA